MALGQRKLFEDEEAKAIVVKKDLELKEAEVFAGMLKQNLEKYCKRIEVVGSIRRRKTEVRDIDYVVVAKPEQWEVMKTILMSMRARIEAAGERIMRCFVPFNEYSHAQVDFYRCPETRWGITKLIRTGSTEHNIWLAQRALNKGMRLQYSLGLTNKAGLILSSRDERSIFKWLDLPYIKPKDREIKEGKPAWKK